MMERDIVLVGHGYWGQNIARNLHELDRLHGICDIREDRLKAAEERYPEAHLFHAFSDVLSDETVAGVAIASPAASHAALALQAMEAGKEVFVEKPLALTYSDGLRMVDAAQTFRRILMVGHLLEYHPAMLKLEELVRNGELGKLQYIYSCRLNLGKFRREENILWSFAPHDIAIILRLVGAQPIEVIATGGAYLHPNVADTTVTYLHFDNGLRAHIFVSWLHPYKEQRLVVIGSKKMAVFDDRAAPGEKLVVYDKGADWVNNVPVPRQGDGVPIVYEHAEPLRREMQHFIRCMETRQQPKTDGRSGLRVLQVLQAAQQSLQMGGSRVPLFQPSRTPVAL